MKKGQKILIIGNKPYYNLNLTNIIDGFDVIYRFNLCVLNKNNGTKYGKLAMCNHVYENFVKKDGTKEQIVQWYKHDSSVQFLEQFYDFFQNNREKFDEIYYQPYKTSRWNSILSKYGCPYKFSKIPSTGQSVIFENLLKSDNEIYVFGFSFFDDEVRITLGENTEVTETKNNNSGCHSFSEEKAILRWLHNNKKIDATLCMLKDTKDFCLQCDAHNTKPSKLILNLLNME